MAHARKKPRRRISILATVATIIAVLALFTAKPLYDAVLRYNGYCVEEQRYLSDEEKVHAAIEHTIHRRYPGPVRGVSFEESQKIKRSAEPYRDVEEFLSVNESCCQFRDRGIDGFPRSFWGRIAGRQSGFVVMEYLVRYRKDDGTIGSSLSKVGMIAVSNCGEAGTPLS